MVDDIHHTSHIRHTRHARGPRAPMIDIAISATRVVAALVLVVERLLRRLRVRLRPRPLHLGRAAGRGGAPRLGSAAGRDGEPRRLPRGDAARDHARLARARVGRRARDCGADRAGARTAAPPNLVHIVAFAIGFSIITFLHVVFGELAPKTIAIAQAERVAMMLAPR